VVSNPPPRSPAAVSPQTRFAHRSSFFQTPTGPVYPAAHLREPRRCFRDGATRVPRTPSRVQATTHSVAWSFWTRNPPKRRHDGNFFAHWPSTMAIILHTGPVPSTMIQSLNPCTCLKFDVRRAEIHIFVGRQNVPLQNRCAWDFEPVFPVFLLPRDFKPCPSTLQYLQRGGRRTRLPGARNGVTIGSCVSCDKVCMQGVARSNCHALALSHLAAGRGKAASVPAAARPHCLYFTS
jgi:hypothetical protein